MGGQRSQVILQPSSAVMLIRARHYATGQLVDILCENGRIISVSEPGTGIPDRQAGWVAPALFDLQINGCDGHSFNSPRLTIETVRHVVRTCRKHGIAGMCPTLVTSRFEALAHGMSVIRQAVERDRGIARAIPAIHLEGPYISPEDGPRGAHPREYVRPPDPAEFARLQDAAGGLIRLVTLAPEHDGALEFIEKLTASGVVVALGHTNATPSRIRDAIRAGARLSTHLGNGCHAVLPRHDNVIWEQLAADDLWASIIADGHHLPASVVRCIIRVKTPARTILTCDASSLAGLPPGRYREWDQDFEVRPEGKVVVAGTPYLAGSAVFTDACIANVIRMAEVHLADAIDMAGENPRRLLQLPPRRLEPGMPAEVLLFNREEGGDLCQLQLTEEEDI
jgi:N-acetylglucosamine-6-phosphate deacetylase